MQTTIMVSLFVIQLVTSIFGAHYLGMPEVFSSPAPVERISNPTFWTFITGGTFFIWDALTNNPFVQLASRMLDFSWKMMWFAVPGCPAFFNYIWLLMTFIVVWIALDKIRGHNT